MGCYIEETKKSESMMVWYKCEHSHI